MTERFFTPAAMAALLGLTTTAGLAAEAPSTVNPEQGWSSIARCAQEDTERARHTCVDHVLRDAGLLTNEMRATQQRRVFGLDDKSKRATPPAPATTPQAVAATPVPAASASRTAPATTTNPAAPAATTPSAPDKAPAASSTPAAAAAAPPADSSEPDRLDVTLTKVEKAVSGRLLVTTDDGAAWLQTESISMPLPPVAGDHMSIRKGAMNGYRCTVTSTHLTYRCIRHR